MKNIGSIDPQELGKLEVGWWIAHNEKDRVKMLKLLVKQHEIIYSMPKIQTLIALKTLVSATKDHDVENWESARKKVKKYYEHVRKHSGLTFDSDRVSSMEVNWWKLHDELEDNEDKSSLADLFSELYSELLGIDKNKLKKAGLYKAEATREHDLAEKPGISKETAGLHWKNAERLLIKFYNELKIVSRK